MPTYDEVVRLTWEGAQPVSVADTLIAKLETIDKLLGVTGVESIGKFNAGLRQTSTILDELIIKANTFTGAWGRAYQQPPSQPQQPPPPPPSQTYQQYPGAQTPVWATGVTQPPSQGRRSLFEERPAQDPFASLRAQARVQQEMDFDAVEAQDRFMQALEARLSMRSRERFAKGFETIAGYRQVLADAELSRALEPGRAEYARQMAGYGFGGGLDEIAAVRAQARQGVGRMQYDLFRGQYLGREEAFGAGISGMRASAQAEQAQMFGAMRGVGREDYDVWRQRQLAQPALARSYRESEEAVRRLRSGVQETDDVMGSFGRSILRHAAIIGVMVVAYEGLRIVTGIVRDIGNEFVRLESVSARLGFITGQGGLPQALAASYAGAQYGISPQESQAGALLGAQLKATGAQQDQARQIAFVFGTQEYTNALSELIQTEKRAQAAGLESVNVLGYLATAYKSVPGTIEEYFDALQDGLTLYQSLGVSAEDAGLIVRKTAFAMEASSQQAANTIQTIINNLRKPERLEALVGFGISGANIPELLKNSAAALQQLINTGQDQRAQELLALLAGGTINVQRIREAPLVFSELSDALASATGNLAKFGELLADVSNTTEKRIDRLTASWGLFLAALGQTDTIKSVFDFLNDQIVRTTAGLSNLSARSAGAAIMGGEPQGRQIEILQQYVKETGGGSLSKLFGVQGGKYGYTGDATTLRMIAEGNVGGAAVGIPSKSSLQQIYADIYSFYDWVTQGQAAGRLQPQTTTPSRTPTPGMPGFGRPGFTPSGGGGPVGWQGQWDIRDLPQGMAFNTLRDAAEKWDKLFTDISPEYKRERPDNLRLTYFRDPLTNTFSKLTTTNDALRMAIEELTKLEREKITGAFNVPAGGEALIAFYAAQAGFVPNIVGPGGTTARGAGRGRPDEQYEFPYAGGGSGRDIPDAWQRMGRQQSRIGVPSGVGPRPFWERPAPSSININNRIIVQLDSRVVSTSLNKQFHQNSYGSGGSSGNPSSLLVE